MGDMSDVTRMSEAGAPYEMVLTLLRNTGCLKQADDPEEFAESFKAVVHALLKQYVSSGVSDLAMAAYDAGLRAGLDGREDLPMIEVNKAARGNRCMTQGLWEVVSRAGRDHGRSIRQEYRQERQRV
ncbi:TPA: hypothetical protein QDC03_006213 [Burkholderia cepacia]|nr:hypothetical protein [Burkholderia cepacia]HDR9511024.1 hypothetical protein [Burkholderia cepacia]